MIGRWFTFGALMYLCIFAGDASASASFVIQSQDYTHFVLKGYSGLTETTLFQGELATGVKQNIATTYKGLALLLFEHGQGYPIIIGNQPFLIKISNPDTVPSFTGSEENDHFYAHLRGAEAGSAHYEFALLMINAKQLLDSTGSISTVDELQTMKEKFHAFVRTDYQNLYHSDMLRRLIAQYFMMHEYVDYHIPGAPATDIQVRYQQAVMDGVRNWLDVLKPNIPLHEILNYIVSLYYDRSMVALAFKIIENFREVAHCPGKDKASFTFPPNLALTDTDGNQKTLLELGGKKTVSFVSDECPVSMVESVIEARRFAQQPNTTLIVVPLQPLSEYHLAISKMVNGGNMFFVDDEKWRKENVPYNIKLPWFILIR